MIFHNVIYLYTVLWLIMFRPISISSFRQADENKKNALLTFKHII